MLRFQEPGKELCIEDTPTTLSASVNEMDVSRSNHSAGTFAPALELVNDRHLASTATQVTVELPDSELDLTDLPDLEEIP